MLLQSIGTGIPAALGVALSPFPVIGVVLILAGPHGRRNGPLFALGWVTGLSAVAALTVLVLSGADDPDSTSSAFADWGRVIVGVVLIVVGVRTFLSRPRSPEETEVPAWMSSLDDAGPGRAVGLGLLLSSANPKNFLLTAAATTAMIEVGASGADLVVAVAVFVVVGSLSVVGAVLVRLLDRPQGIARLEAVRQFMFDNNAVITMVVLVLIGAKVLGDGLGGLGR